MLYKFLKQILKLALRIFFKEYKVIYKTEIPDEGPMIVVANHPNSFMDPIILASLLEQDAHFIAKGTLFNSVFKDWFMRNITKSIPIYRKQDNPAKTKDNDAIFDQCFKFMEEKGTLIIFPEGTSINERKLQDIKTGTARIALGAEGRNDFQLGIKILSVGINYSDVTTFRSDVFINVEELIDVQQYKHEYGKDNRNAVRMLTQKIQDNLEKNLIITSDQQEDQFIREVEAIYKNELVADLNLDPKLHSFTLTKGIEEAVNHFEDLDKTWLDNLKEKVAAYSLRLRNHNLEDRFFARNKKEDKSIFTDSVLRILFVILGFPFYLYGLITNFIPYDLPNRIAHAMTNDEEYLGPIKMTSGILTFSSFYILLIYLFQRFVVDGNWFWTNLFALSLPLAGFFAMWYYERLQNFKSHRRLISLFYKEPELIGELLHERKSIIKELDWGKEQFLKTVE